MKTTKKGLTGERGKERLSYGKHRQRLVKDVCVIDNAYIKREVRAKRLELPNYMKV